MGLRTESEIRYSYRGDGLSPALARHVFRYIASISGLPFREDDASPDICYKQLGRAPESALLTVDRGKTLLMREDGAREILGFDPIRRIADMLSLSFQSGPCATERLSPSPIGETSLSEIVSAFIKALQAAGLVAPNVPPIGLWPAPHPFALALTHDIDIVRRSVAGSVRLLWKRHLPGGLGALFDSAKSFLLGSPNPYDRIREWIAIETRLGLKSTFFAFDGWRRHANDPKYTLSRISADLEAINTSSFELSLHTGIGSHSGQHVPESKKALESAAGHGIIGLRPHYLSARFPQYWHAAAESGFAYSSAIGFDDDIGFLRGIDLPVFPFDRDADRPVNLMEIPIAIMDCGLVGARDARAAETLERGEVLIDRCARSGGLVVLDWHERTLYERDYPGWGRLYFKLVEHARSKGAYFPLMSEIASRLLSRFGGRP